MCNIVAITPSGLCKCNAMLLCWACFFIFMKVKTADRLNKRTKVALTLMTNIMWAKRKTRQRNNK